MLDSVLKKVFKAVLIMVGGLLVLGGGLCAASNIYFALATPSAILLAGFFLMICGVAIWGGWSLLKEMWADESTKQQSDTDGK